MRGARVPLLLIVFMAFALRVIGLTAQSLWRDEVDAIRFAARDLPALLATFRRSGENGPLYFLFLHYWLPLFPEQGRAAATPAGDYALRFFSVLPGVAAVPLAAALARRLFSPVVGLLTALLVATAPYLVWYSQEGKMYALVTALALAALLALTEALRRGGAWRWLLVWAFVTTTAYVHIMALLLVPVGIVWFLLAWPRARDRWVGGLTTLAGLTLPYIPLALWQVRLLFWPRFSPGFPYVPLSDMVPLLVAAFSRGILPASEWTLFPFVFAGLSGLTLKGAEARDGKGGRGWRAVAALVAWLALPTVGLWLISLRAPLFTERYLIWTVPAFLILSARGLVSVWDRSRWACVIALVALLLLNGEALWKQAVRPIKPDFRAAAAFVAARRQPDELVVFLIPYVRFTFAHYYGDPAPWGDAPFTNGGLSAEEVGARLARLTMGYPAAWLIESEGEMWDRRGLVAAWLSEHGQVDVRGEFTGVRVARYALPRR